MKRIIKRSLKWLIIVALVAGAGYILYTKVFKSDEAAVPEMEPLPPITFPVTEETISTSIQVKGKSQYQEETLVYAPFASKVTSWKAENGVQVKKGDVLFTLDQSTLRNEIATVEATARKAQLESELNDFIAMQDEEAAPAGATEAERLKALAAQETAKLSEELNQVNADIQARELADKKAKLQAAVVHAPATGIFLADKSSELPQNVTDNQYIGKIVDLNKLEFIAQVGEQDIFKIKQGMKVQVKMSAIKDLQLVGEVTEVAKFANTASAENSASSVPQFEIVISLQPNEHLIGGLSLTGDIETLRKDKAVVVSSMAVMHEGDAAYVMVDRGDGQIERQDVEVGIETSEKTEIVTGLKAGDTVVLQ
ncbi:efflux RND transporter periplasmic adaptor subunit [Paenibacillus tepidiphilus]|uniref:efflux RND transporter periplasmic adaptor subunit n=1 Tax=Paenibacillus tepidiphilus TaxID=2608683 RepID=UPI00193EA613|nr:efflux RND transporter periplasmic adaptor subunit [Paenibacillus tepidiphilus]